MRIKYVESMTANVTTRFDDPLIAALERAATGIADDPDVVYERKPEFWGAQEVNDLAAQQGLGGGRVFEERTETGNTPSGVPQSLRRFLIVHHPRGRAPIVLHTWSRIGFAKRLPERIKRIVRFLLEWQLAREAQLHRIPPRKPSHTGRKRTGGRLPLPEHEAKKRRALVEAWTLAKSKGVSQGDFAGDRGVSVEHLTKCINWMAQRRRRGEHGP